MVIFVDVEWIIVEVVVLFGFEICIVQSNYEGVLIDVIYDVCGECEGIVINLVGFMYIFVVFWDVFIGVLLLFVEVYILDVYVCEEFWYYLFLYDVVVVCVIGWGVEGYVEVLWELVLLF